jgi:hypothetical protein
MSNQFLSTLDKIHAAGYSGYFSSLFNIESGQVGISDERMPKCDQCFEDASITSNCANCGRTPENFIRFQSGEGDGIYALLELYNPDIENSSLGGLLIFNKNVVGALYGSVLDGHSPGFDLDFSDVMTELQGEYITSVHCLGDLLPSEVGTESADHCLYVGDANSDDSGQYALTLFHTRPGEHSVYLFGEREAALIIPKERTGEFGLSSASTLKEEERTELAIGGPDDLVSGHINPEGLKTILHNVLLTEMDISDQEQFRGQKVNFVSFVTQLNMFAPELLPESIPDYLKEFVSEDKMQAQSGEFRGFKVPQKGKEAPPAPRVWDEPPVTEFSLVTSPLDGEYDPVAKYHELVALGLISPIEPYSEKENADKNSLLVTSLNSFVDGISRLVDGRPHKTSDECREMLEENSELTEQIVTLLNEVSFIFCNKYSEEASVAICRFFDALIEYGKLLDSACNDDGSSFMEYHWDYLAAIEGYNCPRPVLWHLINTVSNADINAYTADMSAPYLTYAIGVNEIVGDAAYAAHSGDGDELTPATVKGAYENPSLTVQTLEKLAMWHFKTAITGHPRGDYYPVEDMYFDNERFTFDLEDEDFCEGLIAPQGSLTIVPQLDAFAFVLARILDEFKLGRLDWERLSNSPNKIYRTLAAYWPGVSLEQRRELVKSEILEFTSQTEDFLEYVFENPYMSVLTKELAKEPLP